MSSSHSTQLVASRILRFRTTRGVASYYLFNGQAVALRDSVTNEISYLVGDQLGSISLLLSASASGAPLVSQQYFMPWGQVRGSGISQTSLNYTGQRLDGTGLLYYHARSYDPVLARFVSADTIAPDRNDPQSRNRYSYVQNNPLRYTDPSGQCAVEDVLLNGQNYDGRRTRGGDPLIGVFDQYPEEALAYYPGADAALQTTLADNGYDVSATLARVQLRLAQWRQDYAQRNNQPAPDPGAMLGAATALGLAGCAPDCFMGPDKGGGSGGGSNLLRPKPNINNLDTHAQNSMTKRGWTVEEINEAYEHGAAYPAVDLTAGGAPATRYVHPTTGKSVVVNNATGRVVHVGGKGFKYD